MPELPDRPDLDHLRHQARELLRTATDGQPVALARLRAVSHRVTLSVAQLALARGYGFPSWTALRAEVERRRNHRWSLGGATAIQAAAGTLIPGLVVIGPDQAVLHASLLPVEPMAHPLDMDQKRAIMAGLMTSPQTPGFDDITITDEQGNSYTMSIGGMEMPADQPIRLRLYLEPVPTRQCGWLELRNREGISTRLLPSTLPAVRIGTVTSGTQRTAPARVEPAVDGRRQHVDIAATLPLLDDTAIRLDSLDAEPESWRVYLRATPGWWSYAEDRKWATLSVHAEDNLGGCYLSEHAGGIAYGPYYEVTIGFQPAIDPLAHTITLTFSGTNEEVSVDIPLTAADPRSIR